MITIIVRWLWSISGWPPPRHCQLHVGRDAVLFITVTLHPPSRIPSTQEVFSDIDRIRSFSCVGGFLSDTCFTLQIHGSFSWTWFSLLLNGEARDNSPRTHSSLEEWTVRGTKNSSLGHWGLVTPLLATFKSFWSYLSYSHIPVSGGTAARVYCPWSPRSHPEVSAPLLVPACDSCPSAGTRALSACIPRITSQLMVVQPKGFRLDVWFSTYGSTAASSWCYLCDFSFLLVVHSARFCSMTLLSPTPVVHGLRAYELLLLVDSRD